MSPSLTISNVDILTTSDCQVLLVNVSWAVSGCSESIDYTYNFTINGVELTPSGDVEVYTAARLASFLVSKDSSADNYVPGLDEDDNSAVLVILAKADGEDTLSAVKSFNTASVEPITELEDENDGNVIRLYWTGGENADSVTFLFDGVVTPPDAPVSVANVLAAREAFFTVEYDVDYNISLILSNPRNTVSFRRNSGILIEAPPAP